MNFPLTMSFKKIALAPQIYVIDANGETLCYVRQKLMKLRENIEVFTDKKRKEKICNIQANKILDFSATYQFKAPSGDVIGAVAREGVKSLWKAHYKVLQDKRTDMTIQEENPLIKVIDGMVDAIPIVGGVVSFLLNPSYLVTNADGSKHLARIKKRPALFESKFTIEKLGDFDEGDELRMVLAALTMILLEKERG